MSVPADFDALTKDNPHVIRAATAPRVREALSRLHTKAQRKAVVTSVCIPSRVDAVRLAGYQGADEVLRVAAWRLWRNDNFIAARRALLAELTSDVGQSISSALFLYDVAAEMARDLGDADALADVQRRRDDFLQYFAGAGWRDG